jgi:hypothetical protein
VRRHADERRASGARRSRLVRALLVGAFGLVGGGARAEEPPPTQAVGSWASPQVVDTDHSAEPLPSGAGGNTIEGNAMRSVVELRSAGGLCAGSLVAPRLVVTAWHCVHGVWPVTARFHDGPAIEDGRVVAKNEAFDLAVVRLPSEPRTPVYLPLYVAPGPPAIGAPVFAIGHPHGDLFKITRGRLVLASGDFVTTDADVNPGNSGGPLCTEDGRLLGVASTKVALARARQLGDFISVVRVKELLDGVRADTPPLSAWDARGGLSLHLGYMRDRHLEDMAGDRVSLFDYLVAVDVWDRLRLGFRQTLFRPEGLRAWELGVKWRIGEVAVVPLVGRNFYAGPRQHGVADKVGLSLEVFGLRLEVFSVRPATGGPNDRHEKSRVAWAVGL